MKIDRFLTIVYIIGAICICLMVYSIACSQSTLANKTNANIKPYDYWEIDSDENDEDNIEYENNQGYDEQYDEEIDSENNYKNTSSKSTKSNKKNNVLSRKSSSRKTASKKTSSRKTSSKNSNSKSVSSRQTSSKNISSKPEKYTGIVNINTANLQQLCSLDGIGEVLAQNIIDFRNMCGGFENIEEIMYVSGIGEGKFELIKDRITVE